MKIGIPKALLYFDYYPFINTFFTELGANIVYSCDTNKTILDLGVKYCVDEACLPVKVFHGHVAYLKDKCDFIFLPRVMQLQRNEFICPKFCGLPEMIKYNIKDLPPLLSYPLYGYSRKKLKHFIYRTGFRITKNYSRINDAFNKALQVQNENKLAHESKFKAALLSKGIKVALAGHPYNINDKFINMNILKKLNNLGIEVFTKDNIQIHNINLKSKELFKRPFWTFAREMYGFTTFAEENNIIYGIIYISSFACGIDSVVIELIKNKMPDFPILILKIDEQTGEAGFDTRLEAFADMLNRKIHLKEGAVH